MIWLEHPKYPGYLFSPDGKVLSLKWKNPRIIKQHTRPQGYRQFTASINGEYSRVYTHRLVAEIYCSNDNNLEQVNHIDNCRSNNNYTNLEFVSRQGNRDHCVKQKRHAHGDNHYYRKLNSEIVKDIVSRVSSGESYFSISKNLSVSLSAVKSVFYGINWSHVTGRIHVKRSSNGNRKHIPRAT